MKIITEVNFTAVDKMNAVVSAMDIKEQAGNDLTVIGLMIYDSVDKATGELKTVGTVKTDDGNIYGFTSATMIECAEMLATAFETGTSSAVIQVVTKQSNNKRTFYQFKVISLN